MTTYVTANASKPDSKSS